MPTFLNFKGYKVFFWTNENNEPIHFHICKGKPSSNATKIWVLSNGSFLIGNNNSKIPKKDLINILDTMLPYVGDFKKEWVKIHKTLLYYK